MTALPELPDFAMHRGNDLEIRLKAVPGAKSDEVVGVLGDRLKVRVSQPPEGGRANEAIQTLLARRLGVALRDVTLVSGEASPLKVFRVRGLGPTAATVCAALVSPPR